MRRSLRILVNVATVLSLLLCVAMAVFWLRSYWRSDCIYWVGHPERGAETPGFTILSAGGGLELCKGFYTSGVVPKVMPDGWHWHVDPGPPIQYANGEAVNRWGVGYGSDSNASERFVHVVFPTLLAVILFALLPATRFALSIRQRYRYKLGHCRRCGYDLRATPERCPECGTVPVPT